MAVSVKGTEVETRDGGGTAAMLPAERARASFSVAEVRYRTAFYPSTERFARRCARDHQIAGSLCVLNRNTWCCPRWLAARAPVVGRS